MNKPNPDAQEDSKRVVVLLSPQEKLEVQVVAAHEGLSQSDLFREHLASVRKRFRKHMARAA